MKQGLLFRYACVMLLSGASALPNAGWAQTAGTVATAAAAQPSAWKLVWSDEFEGTAGSAPDATKWSVEQGLPPDGAQSYNCTLTERAHGCDPAKPNVALDGKGHLAIIARAAPGAPNGMTSGRLKTMKNETDPLFSTEYGRVEARISVPTEGGIQGVWPAFWALGTDVAKVGWPRSGEIDVMEYIGKRNSIQAYATLHGPGYANEGIGARATRGEGWSGFHIYGMIWAKDRIDFYVDDPINIYGSFTAAQFTGDKTWPFNHPFYLLLDLNMGGGFPGKVDATTTFPQTMLVDYVRVYQAK